MQIRNDGVSVEVEKRLMSLQRRLLQKLSRKVSRERESEVHFAAGERYFLLGQMEKIS